MSNEKLKKLFELKVTNIIVYELSQQNIYNVKELLFNENVRRLEYNVVVKFVFNGVDYGFLVAVPISEIETKNFFEFFKLYCRAEINSLIIKEE